MKRTFSILIIAVAIFTAGDVAAMTFPVTPAAYQTERIDNYYRTELYFGRSIPGGGMVSDDEWDKFLAEVVTPRFPNGFTILKATGQYRETNGTIDKEPSEIMVFLSAKKPDREPPQDRRDPPGVRQAI